MKKFFALLITMALSAAALLPVLVHGRNQLQGQSGKPEIQQAVHHDVSPPLRDIPSAPRSTEKKIEKRLLLPTAASQNQHDPVVQGNVAPLVGTTPGLNFAGVGNGDYGFTPNAAQPDTNASVGATQVVQWVNESYAVFDKITGTIAPGFPKAGNSVWSGFGGGCETNNDGDPIAQYDKANNRWILTQFSVTSGSTLGYWQCIAISKTSDATGAYNVYAYKQPNFNDYPKFGVWNGTYYATYNMFSGNSFAGARLCAYDGASMRAGAPAAEQCFQLSNSYGSVLP